MTKTFDELDDRLPVAWVSTGQAVVFCRWLGRRLPTDAEWERAARGTRGRSWPWGEAPATRIRANVLMRKPVRPPVRAGDPSVAGGRSPEGLVELVGNVREYTSTPVSCRTDPYRCRTRWDDHDKGVALVSRGGSWQESAERLDGSDALEVDPIASTEYLGFRCAQRR